MSIISKRLSVLTKKQDHVNINFIPSQAREPIKTDRRVGASPAGVVAIIIIILMTTLITYVLVRPKPKTHTPRHKPIHKQFPYAGYS